MIDIDRRASPCLMVPACRFVLRQTQRFAVLERLEVAVSKVNAAAAAAAAAPEGNPRPPLRRSEQEVAMVAMAPASAVDVVGAAP